MKKSSINLTINTMSCFKSASAKAVSGTLGYLLVIKIKGFSGIVPASYVKGTPPFNPKNVFPLTVHGFVPGPSPSPAELTINQDMKSKDEFDSVEIFCDDKKPGTIIKVTKIKE